MRFQVSVGKKFLVLSDVGKMARDFLFEIYEENYEEIYVSPSCHNTEHVSSQCFSHFLQFSGGRLTLSNQYYVTKNGGLRELIE